MKCSRCHEDFEEKDIQESHNVPCYLFSGNRRGRKQQADKFKRRWLCQKCHEGYEEYLKLELIQHSIKCGEKYFLK